MRLFVQNFKKISFIVILLSVVINAQTDSTKNVESDVQSRVKQLEAQVSAMQAELEALRNSMNKKEVDEPKTATAVQPVKKTENKETVAVQTKEKETTSAKKDLGVDVGDVRITPYGTIYFNAFSNSGGTNNTDIPLWATAGDDGNISASGRQTRFGVRIEGGKIADANVKAVVEADFFGGFPSIGVGENFGVVRLRLANVRLDWEKTSLVIGQNWMVFAPVNPNSIAAAAIPQMASAGNPWSRLPQLRVERKFGKNFRWQGAILAPGTGDFPTAGNPALLQPSSGAASSVPFFQSRISFTETNWFGAKKPGTIGLAGHYGRSRVTVGNSSNEIDSVGVALDWNFPIVNRVNLTGEAFFGRNLAGFQAGIFQGYNTNFAFRQNNTLVAGGVRGIGTRGGWTQIGWNLPAFKDRLTAYASIGIDDPRDKDLITLDNRNFRTRNFSYAFDFIYKLTPQLSFGAEFRRLQTMYLFDGERNNTHINLGGNYSF